MRLLVASVLALLLALSTQAQQASTASSAPSTAANTKAVLLMLRSVLMPLLATLIGVTFALAGCGGSSSSSNSTSSGLSGTWTLTYTASYDSAGLPYTMQGTVLMTQTGNQLTGSMTCNSGTRGCFIGDEQLSGVVTNDVDVAINFAATCNVSGTPEAGTISLTGTIQSGTVMSGNYGSTMGCVSTDPGDGNFTMTKQ